MATTTASSTVTSVNYSGLKVAQVMDVIDTDLEGKIKVYIPSMSYDDDFDEEPSTSSSTVSKSLLNSSQFGSSIGSVSYSNYLIARPMTLITQDKETKVLAGKYQVPTKSSKILVFFLDEDPQKLYYIPSTCTTDGYSKINSRNTSSNWGDYKKQHNIDVIRSYVNYNRIEVDNTSGEECYRVMMGPKESEAWKILVNQGKKYISLESPQQSAIVKVTDGKVTLKSGGATVEVSGSNVKVSGTGNVNVNGSNINMTGTTKISGNTTMNGNTNVSGNTTISGKTTMTSATVGGSPVVTEATVGAIVKKYIPDGIITSANISSYIPQ